MKMCLISYFFFSGTGLYAIVLGTANFRQDVRQEIRMMPVQSVQRFT